MSLTSASVKLQCFKTCFTLQFPSTVIKQLQKVLDFESIAASLILGVIINMHAYLLEQPLIWECIYDALKHCLEGQLTGILKRTTERRVKKGVWNKWMTTVFSWKLILSIFPSKTNWCCDVDICCQCPLDASWCLRQSKWSQKEANTLKWFLYSLYWFLRHSTKAKGSL